LIQKLSLEIPKETNTYADALFAAGTASLLKEIFGDTGEPSIKDRGNSFILEVDSPNGFARLNDFQRFSAGYPFIKQKEDEEIPIGVEEVFDYPQQKKIEEIWNNFRKETGKKKGKITADSRSIGIEQPSEPHIDLRLHKIMASMRKGWKSDKEFYRFLIDNREITTNAALNHIKDMARMPIEYPEDESNLQKVVTGCQVLMPVGGKGVNRSKPDSTGKAGFPSEFLDWFSEWMKYRGMYKSLLAYRNEDDFKFFVIMPVDISYTALKRIRDELFKENLWGGIKLDIQAILTLAQILIKHSKEYDPKNGIFSILKRPPNKIISGLSQAYFQSMGTAASLMNYSFLGLPGWFDIGDSETAVEFWNVLEEHKICTRSLNEKHSDDIPLLEKYRQFLSSGDYEIFLDFLSLYGPYIMRNREQGNIWIKQFTVHNLGRLFCMNQDYSEIVSNEGFLNLAAAIRKATVNAQYRKAQGTRAWDIKYGLAQDWKRVAQQPDKLVAAISDFVQQYNAENARHAEQSKERRSNITTRDLDHILDLIKKHGSYLVGMLLLAYGYARESREDEDIIEEKGEKQ
jgi:hypothetical protein